MDIDWMYRKPYFGEMQEADGRWVFFYKWMPSRNSYYMDGVKVDEVDRERKWTAAKHEVWGMCADLMRQVGAGDD